MPPTVERRIGAWKEAPFRTGFEWPQQLVIACLAVFLIFSHRPDAFTNPQFYAEDGAVWFAQAYNAGWLHSLTLPQNGYIQTLPRVAAGLALLVPLRWAPMAMNLVGLTVQVLPVTFLLSKRTAQWGPLPLRALWALAYLLLPNAMELDVSATEGEFHLALLTLLVILAEVPKTVAGRVFDVAVIVLGGLTGPFCLLFLPIAAVYAYLRRERWRVVPIVLLIGPALWQLLVLLQTGKAARSQAALGATPQLFLQLLVGRVYLGALWGHSSLAAQQHAAILLVGATAGTSVVIYSLLKARVELRLLVVFCFVMLGLAMARPMASYVSPQWPILSTAAGHHYWFLPMVGFVWCLLWCCFDAETTWLRNTARLLALTMPLGVLRDWRYPAYADMHYATSVQQFAAAPAGTSFAIPIFPGGWAATLIKRPPGCAVSLEGVLDSPKDGATVSGPVQVMGWAIAPGGRVNEVVLKMDGHTVKQFRPAVVRLDVDAVHPEAAEKLKGWQGEFDASTLTPGKHQLEVWASAGGSCAAKIAQASVERAR